MTQLETYNETFWIAIAAAAPVIALASTVQITDIQKLFVFTKEEVKFFPWQRYIGVPVTLSTGNILLQIICMYAALTSLARHSNFLNLSQVIILEVVGMAVVAVVAFVAVLGHMKVNKVRGALAKDDRKTDSKTNGGDAQVAQVPDLTVKPDAADG
jgi:hypothetical protein